MNIEIMNGLCLLIVCIKVEKEILYQKKGVGAEVYQEKEEIIAVIETILMIHMIEMIEKNLMIHMIETIEMIEMIAMAEMIEMIETE
jgi:hypothetical protein